MKRFILISLRTGDSYQALREENQYLRKQLAQAEWSIQQLRGTEEQNLSGSEEEEESDGVWISMYSVFLFVAGYVCTCLYHQIYDHVARP